MNIEELHKNFDYGDMRNYLIKTYTKASKISLFVETKELERQMKILQEKISNARIVESIECIIEAKNWQQFDISEIIEHNDDIFAEFIGTKEDYTEALELCKYENSIIEE